MAVSATTRELVRRRAGGLCEYCHANERWQFVRFTLDHIVPQSAGGLDLADNLALACRNCNERRGDRSEAVDPETGRTISIFNPRRQVWNRHFAWSNDRLRLVGLSSCGRATIQLLDINGDRHDGIVLAIRQRDLEDGWHPPPQDTVIQ